MTVDFWIRVPKEALQHPAKMWCNTRMVLKWMRSETNGCDSPNGLRRMDVYFGVHSESCSNQEMRITLHEHEPMRVVMDGRQVLCEEPKTFRKCLEELHCDAINEVIEGVSQLMLIDIDSWKHWFHLIESHEEDGMHRAAMSFVKEVVCSISGHNTACGEDEMKYVLMPLFEENETGEILRALTRVLRKHNIMLHPAYRMDTKVMRRDY